MTSAENGQGGDCVSVLVREMRNRQAWTEGYDIGFLSNEKATKAAKGKKGDLLEVYKTLWDLKLAWNMNRSVSGCRGLTC